MVLPMDHEWREYDSEWEWKMYIKQNSDWKMTGGRIKFDKWENSEKIGEILTMVLRSVYGRRYRNNGI